MSSVIKGCPGTYGTTCVTISNYSEETVVIYDTQTKTNINGEDGKPLGVESNQIQIFQFSNTSAGRYEIVGWTTKKVYTTVNLNRTTIEIINQRAIRVPLKKQKSFPFWVAIVFCLLVVIVCSAAAVHIKKSDVVNYCLSRNLSEEECEEELALGEVQQDGPSPSPFVAGGVIAAIFMIGLFVMWWFCQGPGKWASYSTCTKRSGFGSVWFWVKPQSKFRGFLCSAFGACECASDFLEEICHQRAVDQAQNYKWDINDARKSSNIQNNCLCCTDNGCINPETGGLCK